MLATCDDLCVGVRPCAVTPRAQVHAAEVPREVRWGFVLARRIKHKCVKVADQDRRFTTMREVFAHSPAGLVCCVVAFPERQALIVPTDTTPHERGVNVRIVRATALSRGCGTECPATVDKKISIGVDL